MYFTCHASLWHHGSLSMGGQGGPVSEYFFIRNIIFVMHRHVRLGPFLPFYGTAAWMTLSSLAKGLIRRPTTLPARTAAVLGLLDGSLCLVWARPIRGAPPSILWLQRRAPRPRDTAEARPALLRQPSRQN